MGSLPHISPATPENGLTDVVFSAEQIAVGVRRLGQEIVRDYTGKSPLLVGILNGCIPFLSDLMREIDLPVEVDFMAVSSYGDAAKSSGVVQLVKDLTASITDRDVILVEDIVDTGLTLSYLLENLRSRRPRSLEICSLLVKGERADVRYKGFDCPDAFIVGYGLDFAGRYRNLPMIGVLDPKIYGGTTAE